MTERSRDRAGRGLALLLVATLATSVPELARAATVRVVDFETMTREAGLIVRATALRVTEDHLGAVTPPVQRPAPHSLAPARTGVGVATAGQAPATPVGLPVEGRGVPRTRVLLRVDEVVKGQPPTFLELSQPGGTSDGHRLWVPGLPRFAEGTTYVLFLRERPERTGVPVVGVHQGLFHVRATAAGEQLLDAAGDPVVGIVDGRVAVRRDGQAQAQAGPTRVAAPVPDPAYREALRLTANPRAAQRSASAPWTPARFLDAVRAILESP